MIKLDIVNPQHQLHLQGMLCRVSLTSLKIKQLMATLPLGQSTQYPDHYDPSLLFPIPRIENRKKLGIKENQALPFVGVDIWNAFELSWLNKKESRKLPWRSFKFRLTRHI